MIGYAYRDEGRPLLCDGTQLLDDISPEELSEKPLRLHISLEKSRSMLSHPSFLAASSFDEQLKVLTALLTQADDSAGE